MRSRSWATLWVGTLGAALLVVSQSARAGMDQTWNVPNQATDFTVTHDFQPYSGPGALQSVTVTMQYTVGQQFAFEFTPPGATSMTITGEASAALSDTSAGGMSLLSDTYSKAVTRLPTDSDLNPFFSSGPITKTVTFTSAADLALFTGTNPITFSFAATGGASTTTVDGPGIGGVNTSESATVILSYLGPNPPTPEPASLVLLALGGGILSLASWRGRGTSRRAVAPEDRPTPASAESGDTPG